MNDLDFFWGFHKLAWDRATEILGFEPDDIWSTSGEWLAVVNGNVVTDNLLADVA